MTSCGAARVEVLILRGFVRKKDSGGAQHTGTQDGLQTGRKFSWSKTRQNRILSLGNIFLSAPSAMLKQVCCCFHNLGEEIKPLSVETSGAKPNRPADTPSGLPGPRWRRHRGSPQETLASGSPVPLLPGLWLGPYSWEEREQCSRVLGRVASGAAAGGGRAACTQPSCTTAYREPHLDVSKGKEVE